MKTKVARDIRYALALGREAVRECPWIDGYDFAESLFPSMNPSPSCRRMFFACIHGVYREKRKLARIG